MTVAFPIYLLAWDPSPLLNISIFHLNSLSPCGYVILCLHAFPTTARTYVTTNCCAGWTHANRNQGCDHQSVHWHKIFIYRIHNRASLQARLKFETICYVSIYFLSALLRQIAKSYAHGWMQIGVQYRICFGIFRTLMRRSISALLTIGKEGFLFDKLFINGLKKNKIRNEKLWDHVRFTSKKNWQLYLPHDMSVFVQHVSHSSLPFRHELCKLCQRSVPRLQLSCRLVSLLRFHPVTKN